MNQPIFKLFTQVPLPLRPLLISLVVPLLQQRKQFLQLFTNRTSLLTRNTLRILSQTVLKMKETILRNNSFPFRRSSIARIVIRRIGFNMRLGTCTVGRSSRRFRPEKVILIFKKIKSDLVTNGRCDLSEF